MALAVSLSLMVTLLDLRPAEAQGDITGLLSAGTYVETPAATAGSPKIVVIYYDGNWTLFDPVTNQTLFGVWEERVGEPTDTDTATDTDTSTDTANGTGAVTLNGTLVDPAGTPLPYTLQLDALFTSMTVRNSTTQETFEAVRQDVSTGTETDTTPTSTETDTTPTSTETDTTPTSTETDTTPTSTETDTGAVTSTQ
jgi:hypothetical protein